MTGLRAKTVSLASTLDAISLRFGQRLLSPTVFVGAILFYLLVLFVIRGFMVAGGPNDDSEQLLYSQAFAWGYGLRNPPLYTWLVIGAEAVFGVTLAAPVAVKFILLAATYLTLLGSARRMARDPRWAAAAAAAPLGLYYVAWDAVQNYSHTVLLVFICAATHLCLLCLAERATLTRYALLGLAIGVGVVTKYNYPVFAAALILAAATEPAYRIRLTDRRIVLTIVLAMAVAAPYALYAIEHAGAKTGIPPGSLPNDALPFWSAAAAGFEKFLSFGVGFLSPLLFLLPVFFPLAFRKLSPDAGRPGPAIRVTGIALLIQGVLFLVLFILAFVFGLGVPTLHPHLFFIFILAPLWFLTRASYAPMPENALPRFAVVLCALALVVPLVTLGKLVLDPATTRRPVYNVPYAALAEALKQAGFTAGTVFTWDQPYPLSGNMRVAFPTSRFITGKFPFYAPPARSEPGQCLVLWTIDGQGVDAQVKASFAAMTGSDAPVEQEPSLITLPMLSGWGRSVTFKYQLLKDGSGSCR